MIDILTPLLNYGMSGLFIAYLIYDRTVILRGLQDTMKQNTIVMDKLIVSVNELGKYINRRRR